MCLGAFVDLTSTLAARLAYTFQELIIELPEGCDQGRLLQELVELRSRVILQTLGGLGVDGNDTGAIDGHIDIADVASVLRVG